MLLPRASIAAAACLLPSLAAANCWLRNGSDVNDQWGYERYTPCTTTNGGASMCCSTLYGGDRCNPISSLGASLCWNQGANVLWREQCTDRTWQSPFCVKLFMNVTDQDITVTNCSAFNLGSGFCYGNLNLGCCSAGMAVFIDPVTGKQVDKDPALSSTTTSASRTATAKSSTLTPSSSSSPAATSAAASPDGMSTGTKAGIGAGVAIAAVAFIILVAFIIVRRKRRNQQMRYDPVAVSQPRFELVGKDSVLDMKKPLANTTAAPLYPLEMGHSNPRAELGADDTMRAADGVRQSRNIRQPAEME